MKPAVSLPLAALLLGVACSAPPAPPPAPPPPPALVPATPLGVVLVAYEDLRRDFAADQPERIVEKSAQLRDTAALLADGQAGKDDVVKGAAALAALPAPLDWKAARIAFGDLSRGVVAAATADSTLQPGRFLFECPMAQGYQRWVQLEAKMANPYMGLRMLECGLRLPVWSVAAPAP